MKKIRVLHAIDSAGFYGAEQVIIDIALGSASTEFENIIGCFYDRHDKESELEKRAKDFGLEVVRVVLNGKFNPFAILKAAKVIKHANIDIIHSHGYKTDIICYLANLRGKIKLLATNHLFKKADKKIVFYHKFDILVLKRLKIVVAVSEEIRDIYIQKGLHPDKVKVVDNGIDLNRISNTIKTNIFDKYKFEKNNIIIGTLGRLNIQKGFVYLIDAISKLYNEYPNCKFIIAGTGPQKTELEDLIKNKNLTGAIYLFGYCNQPINFLKNIDIFILPSIDEGLPIALLEAMACKIPIIATDVGSISKVINNMENGLLGPAKSVDYLIKSLKMYIDNPEIAQRYAENGYKTVYTRFSNERMVDDYIQLYKELLKD